MNRGQSGNHVLMGRIMVGSADPESAWRAYGGHRGEVVKNGEPILDGSKLRNLKGFRKKKTDMEEISVIIRPAKQWTTTDLII